MPRKKPGHVCPTCTRPFANAGGLSAHRRLSKDSAHVAARGEPEPQPEPEAAGLEEPTQEAPEEVPEPEPVPEPVQQEARATVVRFEAPRVVKPLREPQQEEEGDPDAEGDEAATGEAGAEGSPQHKETVSSVPLEPFIAASLATVCNGFFLDPKKGDEDVTAQEVGGTGFPKALEVSVRHYWPDLPLDHPAVLLTISGAAMVALVKAKRADRDNPPQRAPEGERHEQPEPEPEPESVQVQASRGASKEAAMLAAMMGGA